MVKDRLKAKREEKNMSLSRLSELTGIPKSNLQRYETGTTKKIPMDVIANIEKALGLNTGCLMGWDKSSNIDLYKIPNISNIEKRKIPVLGSIACGKPVLAEQELGHYYEASSDIQADFCLIAQGDSMIGARIMDGDIVFIRQQPTVENGEIAAVVIGNEATLKRFYYDASKKKLVLQAENPKYEPLVYIDEELNDIIVIGKAVAFQSNVI